jgi:FkbM family methyltransferase
MSYDLIKRSSKSLGLYPLARWFDRHVIARHKWCWYCGERAFYARLIGPGDLVFDVGANNGVKSEVFLALGARVVAFEPQADCLQELHARLGGSPRLITIPAAVGRRRGVVTLYVNPARTASSCIKDWQGEAERAIQVPMTTLDDAIALHGVPAYCKIDVEGFEPEVLGGLSRRIPLVLFEFHRAKGGDARTLVCLDLLAGLGEIRVNMTSAETPGFVAPCWLGKDDFLAFFRDHRGEFWYGDAFVRIDVPGGRS